MAVNNNDSNLTVTTAMDGALATTMDGSDSDAAADNNGIGDGRCDGGSDGDMTAMTVTTMEGGMTMDGATVTAMEGTRATRQQRR
jgi:hypothetical protein